MPEVDRAERGSPIDMEASYCILKAGLPVLVCSVVLCVGWGLRLGKRNARNKR